MGRREENLEWHVYFDRNTGRISESNNRNKEKIKTYRKCSGKSKKSSLTGKDE